MTYRPKRPEPLGGSPSKRRSLVNAKQNEDETTIVQELAEYLFIGFLGLLKFLFLERINARWWSIHANHLPILQSLHAIFDSLAIVRTGLRRVVAVRTSVSEHSRNGRKERNETTASRRVLRLWHESICRLRLLFYWLMFECRPRTNRVSEEEETDKREANQFTFNWRIWVSRSWILSWSAA